MTRKTFVWLPAGAETAGDKKRHSGSSSNVGRFGGVIQLLRAIAKNDQRNLRDMVLKQLTKKQ